MWSRCMAGISTGCPQGWASVEMRTMVLISVPGFGACKSGVFEGEDSDRAAGEVVS